MLPVLHARLGDHHLVLSTYGLCVALGVGAGFVTALRRARRPDVVLVVAALAVVAGVGGATAWHRAVHSAPGLSSMGGIAGAVVAILVACRCLHVRPLEVLDAIAPGMVLGFAIGRVGCFLAGCCHGTETTVAWGVVLAEHGGMPRHPVQLYEAAVLGTIAAALLRTVRPPGITVARALIGYGLARVVLEVWRDPAGVDLVAPSGPTVAQACGAALAVAGLLVERRRQNLQMAAARRR